MKGTKILFPLLAATLLFAAPASAQLPINGGWQAFGWSGLGSVDSPFDAFGFNPAQDVRISIADCCIIGDQFRLSWTGTTVGSFDTSDPTAFDGTSIVFDPDVSFADARNSTGSVIFGAGSYTFNLETIRLATGFDDGAAWIRADTVVPEPATMTLLATGLVGMIGAGMRRRKKA